MEWDVRRNPGLLKLDLYCQGMRIDDSCMVEQDGGRGSCAPGPASAAAWRSILPGRTLDEHPGGRGVREQLPLPPLPRGRPVRHQARRRASATEIAEITLSPRPAWYDRATTTGKKMRSVGSLQGTYLGVYPAKVCEYWTEKTKSNCKFCSVGLNLGVDDADEKSVREVMEVVWAAIDESGITYVDFNTGHYAGHTYLDILEPYIREIKRQTGLLIGIQTPPHPDLKRYDALRDLGVNRVSFCFEIFDEPRFREVCPGKDREYGLKKLPRRHGVLRADSRAAAESSTRGSATARSSSASSRPSRASRAIDWITVASGAIPTVCVFRPLKGTDYDGVPPPKTEEMVPVFRRLYEACMEHNLPIGVAPNIHVSLVLLPGGVPLVRRQPGEVRAEGDEAEGDVEGLQRGFYRQMRGPSGAPAGPGAARQRPPGPAARPVRHRSDAGLRPRGNDRVPQLADLLAAAP